VKIIGNWETREITVDGKKLSPLDSQKVWNHSPDGFSWGYGGSGPAQLALALLLLVTHRVIATRLHQALKEELIAGLPQGDFFTEFDLKKWVLSKRYEAPLAETKRQDAL